MTADLAAFRVIAIGHVQGVGFRAFVQSICRAHGIGGWVRNREDGAVEAEIHGPRPAADQAIAQIRAGRAHQLRRLIVDPAPVPTVLSSSFEIRW